MTEENAKPKGAYSDEEDALDALGMLLPNEQIEQCLAIQDELIQKGIQRGICEIALAQGFVSIDQLQQIGKYFTEHEASEDEPPDIPGYQIMEELGAGRVGPVYKAKQVAMDRDVAIKVVPQRLLDEPGAVDRFLEEARAVAKLNHPNVVQAYNCGRTGSGFYIVMEFVAGGSLRDLMDKEGQMDEQRALDLAIQASRGLYHAHLHGIAHCDLRPSNVLVAKRDQVKLVDFGLSRLVSADQGQEDQADRSQETRYLAPEIITGGKVPDSRCDIYSLGVILYEMLAGKLPDDEATRPHPEPRQKALPDVRGARVDASEATSLIVARCTDPNPDTRYAEPSQLLRSLQRSLAELQRKEEEEEFETALLQRMDGVLRPYVPQATPPSIEAPRKTPDEVLEEMEAERRAHAAPERRPSDLMVRCTVVSGPGKGDKADIKSGQRLTIGREASICSLVLKDPTISRLHCVIAFDGKNIRLEDAGSRNGTYLNGRQVRSAALRPPTTVVVGNCLIRVETTKGAWMAPR